MEERSAGRPDRAPVFLAGPQGAAPPPLPADALDGIDGGKLAANVMHFGRVLRKAGLPVGPGKVIDAVQAVAACGTLDRNDLYWTLHAVFVNRRDQRPLFDQAFHVFWKNPKLLERMMSLVLPQLTLPESAEKQEMTRRLAEALSSPRQGEGEAPPAEEKIELDAALTWSDREILQSKDFEQMSAQELAEARAMLRRLALPIREARTRRFKLDPHGPRVDLRATLRRALRGAGVIDLARKRLRTRPPPLVVLCDISGSMGRYSRMFLHFLHALTSDRDRVHSFVFGTRLTNITRQLRTRDVDEAMEKVAGLVQDWSGGTRIGAALEAFNRSWSRRVLGQGAVVLLITDGLDRDGAEGLAAEAERLAKSCRRLIWLNPLLRWDGYAPKSQGARALLPHVDEFRSAHNLNSLADLAAALSAAAAPRGRAAQAWTAALADGPQQEDRAWQS